MTVNHSVRHAVRRALAIGALAVLGAKAPLLLAQQATPPPPSGGTPALSPPVLQTVIVTGTMIQRPAAETAEAITVISSSALKDMGVVNVEQSVDQITANMPSTVNIAQSVSTFTGGGSFANLRGLGLGRTLVLLDGQRLADDVVGEPTGSSVDLSGIPFGAIQSVQVLREGASSLYGSDAIGGVINFITRNDYQGGEVELNLDRPQENGGGSGEADFTLGHGSLEDDGYNFMITGSYSKQNELKAYQRSFAATGFDPALGLANLNGPTATWPGSYTDANGNLWQVGYPGCAGNPYLTTSEGDCEYEYSAAVDLIPESSEASGMAAFTKALPGNNTLKIQYFYTRSKITQWTGPQSFSFYMTSAADPAYFPTAAESTCFSNVTTGGACTAAPDLGDEITAGWTDPTNNRYSDDINTEQRVVLTFSGESFGWNYTANLNYSVNQNTQGTVGGYANYAQIAPGGILSNLINPFGPQTPAGNAFLDSSYLNGVYAQGKLQYYDVDGHVSHDLGDAFHSGHAAVLAVGFSAQYNSINFASTPLANELYQALYFPPTNVTGSYSNAAIYSELDVPVSSRIDLNLSDREDRYSDFGETNNGKVAVRYQPARYLTFRGAASTGFRAPSLDQLYSPDVFGATAGTIGDSNPDCLAGNFNSEFTKTVCASQGLGLTGGNRDLQPETSENFDFGVIIEPLPNLGITVDYYKILIKNALGIVPDTAIYGDPAGFAADYVLNNTGTLTPAPESNTQCGPTTYAIPTCGYIVQTDTNTGGITTDGFDLSGQYSRRTPFGTFNADLEGTLITHFRVQEYTGGPQVDLLGWYNGGFEPAIHWQHLLRLGWTSPGRRWGAGVDNRFFSSYIDEFAAAGRQLRVGSQSTWDVFGSYKPIAPVTVLLGINNALNQTPPFSNQTGNWPAGYNPIYSSPLLREFYLNVKYTFL